MSNELVVVTGARNTGKSLLAATYLEPEDIHRMYVHDSENSMNRILKGQKATEYGFGRYVDLKARFSDLPGEEDLLGRINAGELPWVTEKGRSSLAEYYQYIIDDLDQNLEPGKYTVYVHDTLEKFEAGMVAWVDANKRKAGVTSIAYGKLWSEGVYVLYENLLAALYARGIETVIMCSHLKVPWEGNRPVVGKVVPSGKKLLYRLSSLFLWLVNNRHNFDGAPAGLVLKERMGSLRVVNGKWKMQRMLPERIPHCTWEDINHYLAKGCNLENPAPGESMSEAERGMISELLTDEQMRLMLMDAEKELLEARQGSILGSGSRSFQPPTQEEEIPFEEQVRLMLVEGKTELEIREATGKPLPVVKAVIKRFREVDE